MKKLYGYISWLYILLAMATNLMAFLAFPGGLDWPHFLIVLSGALSAAAFVMERFFHRGGKQQFQVLDEPPKEIHPQTLQDLDDGWDKAKRGGESSHER